MTGRGPSDVARDDPDRAHALRESFTLPFVFITVVIGGGFRAAADTGAFSFAAPPLVHLVLAWLVFAVLLRAGVLVPDRLVSAGRRPVENLAGTLVLVGAFAATAQALHAVTPESGLLHFFFVVFFAVLFWNTLAMAPDAGRALRSLALVLGSALVLVHVVLASLADPRPSLTKRVLTAMLEGLTLGGLRFEPTAAITGYVAFATIVLYLAGLVLLPRAMPPAPGARATGLVVAGPREALATPADPEP